MSTDYIDQLSRMIKNLYTGVYERSARRQNSPLSNVFTIRETITFTDEVTVDVSVIKARYYHDLTAVGTYTEAGGFTGANGKDGFSAIFSATQGWAVFKIAPTWASGAAPNATQTLMQWQDDASNGIRVYYDQATTQWRLRRVSGGAGAEATVAGSHSANATITLIVHWNATTVKISLNGGAFVSVANTSIPTLTSRVLNLGYGVFSAESKVSWILAGEGVLAASDVTTLAALGTTDPGWSDVPETDLTLPSFLWQGVDNTHLVTAYYGENVYAA